MNAPTEPATLAQRLAEAGVETPDVDARLLLRHVSPPRLDEAIQRRIAREPLQLILGTAGFRYLELEVHPGVFIPRPETEVLAGEAVSRTPPGGIVVEPCTGTGAIAIAVATEARPSAVYATDISEVAVGVARRNAKRAAVSVEVVRGDLLEPLPTRLRGRLDVLVANPPYVTAEEFAELPPEVAHWDPRSALVAGATGHEISDRLILAAPAWLRPGGWLLLETSEHRAGSTAERAAGAGLEAVAIEKDLAGRERVVLARRPVHAPSPRRA